MRFESAILHRTRFGRYRRCLQVLQAYADLAPWWERLALLGYCGLGSWVIMHLGVDIATLWMVGETIVGDILAVSRRSPQEIAQLLRQHVRMRLSGHDALPVAEAKARIYDQIYYPVAAHIAYAMQASAAARLKFVLEAAGTVRSEAARVADLGCGPGVMLAEILRAHPGWKGCGLDISASSVEFAERLAARIGVADRAEFTPGDVARLPFATGSMDLVVASEVFEHLPSIRAALAEAVRVLRPGGRLALTLPMETHAPTHVHSLAGAGPASALLEQAGLRVERCITRRERLRYGDDPAHLFLLAATPAAPALEPEGIPFAGFSQPFPIPVSGRL